MVSSLVKWSASSYPVTHRLCIVILLDEHVNDVDDFPTKSTVFGAREEGNLSTHIRRRMLSDREREIKMRRALR